MRILHALVAFVLFTQALKSVAFVLMTRDRLVEAQRLRAEEIARESTPELMGRRIVEALWGAAMAYAFTLALNLM